MNYEIKDNRIILNEPLVDIEEIFELIKVLNSFKNRDSVILDMKNNYSLPSTLIGQLRVLKENGVKVEIWIYNDLLYSLFEDLGLTDLFEIKKK